MLKLFLILLGLISTINFAVAEEDLVTTVTVPKEAIEIIVFSNINGQNVSKTPELFPDHVGELNKNNSIELNDQQLPLKSLLNAYKSLYEDP